MCSVVFFYERRYEKADVKCRQCVFSNISTMEFLVGSPLEIDNPVPAGQSQFPQFRVIEIFASKVSTDAVIMGHSRVIHRIFY